MDYGEKINLCFRGIQSVKFNYVLLSFRNCSFSEHRHNHESVYSECYQSDYPHRLSNHFYMHILPLIYIDIPKYFAILFSCLFVGTTPSFVLILSLPNIEVFSKRTCWFLFTNLTLCVAIVRPHISEYTFIFLRCCKHRNNCNINQDSFVDIAMG